MSNPMFNTDIMDIVNEFHGIHSDMYLRILSKYHLATTRMKTSIHHIGGSISRIDEYAETHPMNTSVILDILNACICKGELQSVKNISEWAKTNGLRIGGLRKDDTGKKAVISGDMDIIKWCHTNGFLFNERVMTAAASTGRIDVIRFLLGIKCPVQIASIEEAAAQGDLEIVKLIGRNLSCSINCSRAVSYAARNGHLSVMKYLVVHGHGICDMTPGFAALGGHLDILKYILANGYIMGTNVCYMAAMRGHLDIIKWARLEGMSWDQWTIRMASKRKHYEIVEYAIDNGCPY